MKRFIVADQDGTTADLNVDDSLVAVTGNGVNLKVNGVGDGVVLAGDEDVAQSGDRGGNGYLLVGQHATVLPSQGADTIYDDGLFDYSYVGNGDAARIASTGTAIVETWVSGNRGVIALETADGATIMLNSVAGPDSEVTISKHRIYVHDDTTGANMIIVGTRPETNYINDHLVLGGGEKG